MTKKRIAFYYFYQKEIIFISVLFILSVITYFAFGKIYHEYYIALWAIIFFFLLCQALWKKPNNLVPYTAGDLWKEKKRLRDIHNLIRDLGISKKELNRLLFHDEQCEKAYDDYIIEGNEPKLKEFEQLLKQRVSSGSSRGNG